MILAIDGTNWTHSLWHTVGDRAPRLAAVCDYCTDRMACSPQFGQTFHPVVCWDRRSFRHDCYPGYKAGRAEKDPGLVKALAEGPQAMSDAAQIAVDGFEADDLLASRGDSHGVAGRAGAAVAAADLRGD